MQSVYCYTTVFTAVHTDIPKVYYVHIYAYVCMYICVYVCIYICIYIYIYIYLYTYPHIYIYIFVYIHTHIYISSVSFWNRRGVTVAGLPAPFERTKLVQVAPWPLIHWRDLYRLPQMPPQRKRLRLPERDLGGGLP